MTEQVVAGGKECKVVVTAGTVFQMATWSYSGMTRDIIEKGSAFQEENKQFFRGALDGGSITIHGFYVATANAIATLITNCVDDTAVGGLKLYYNDSGYWGPSTTPAASVFVESVDGPSVDANGVSEIGFTMRVNKGYLDKLA